MVDQEERPLNGGQDHVPPGGPPLDLFILAFLFSVMLLVLIVFAFSNVTDNLTWTNTRDLLEILLPTLVGLVGAIVGFYFGTRK